jgi:hypothetical protein
MLSAYPKSAVRAAGSRAACARGTRGARGGVGPVRTEMEVERGLTAGTFQHECDHLAGRLFVDRVVDTTTLTTWAQFERFHRDAFIARITEFVDRVGS